MWRRSQSLCSRQWHLRTLAHVAIASPQSMAGANSAKMILNAVVTRQTVSLPYGRFRHNSFFRSLTSGLKINSGPGLFLPPACAPQSYVANKYLDLKTRVYPAV